MVDTIASKRLFWSVWLAIRIVVDLARICRDHSTPLPANAN